MIWATIPMGRCCVPLAPIGVRGAIWGPPCALIALVPICVMMTSKTIRLALVQRDITIPGPHFVRRATLNAQPVWTLPLNAQPVTSQSMDEVSSRIRVSAVMATSTMAQTSAPVFASLSYNQISVRKPMQDMQNRRQ